MELEMPVKFVFKDKDLCFICAVQLATKIDKKTKKTFGDHEEHIRAETIEKDKSGYDMRTFKCYMCGEDIDL